MTDENKLHRDVSRQARAEDLMRNEMLTDAFAYLDKVFMDSWRVCVDPGLREELWRSQANLANLRKQLSTVVAHGKLAQREIEQLAEKRKRVFGIV